MPNAHKCLSLSIEILALNQYRLFILELTATIRRLRSSQSPIVCTRVTPIQMHYAVSDVVLQQEAHV